MNKDKKPELLIQYGSCEGDVKTVVYTYKNNKAIKVDSFYSGHTGYIPYPGRGLLNIQSHMGYCEVSVITMKNRKINFKNCGSQKQLNGDYCLPGNYLYSHIIYEDDSFYLDYSDLK